MNKAKFSILISFLTLGLLSYSCSSSKEQRQEEDLTNNRSQIEQAQVDYNEWEDEWAQDVVEEPWNDEWDDDAIVLDDSYHQEIVVDNSLIRDVQQQLEYQGYESRPLDGIWGPKTEKAVMDYQREQGLAVTGRLNRETLDSLGVDYAIEVEEETEIYSE